jgi:hypothetical protein
VDDSGPGTRLPRPGPPWLKAELSMSWPLLVRTSSVTPFAQFPRLLVGLRVPLDPLWR